MNRNKFQIMVVGASGMLGSTLFRELSKIANFDVRGTIRDDKIKQFFEPALRDNLISDIDLTNDADLKRLFECFRPEVTINCVGIIKQSSAVSDQFENIVINSLLPHRLSRCCVDINSRFIHFSTDCVFSGERGFYTEDDCADARDLYGRTKFLGEVINQDSLTLRTSIIGHELSSNKSLIDWFLSQSRCVKGFTRAIFSGLPTIEIARVLVDYIIPNPKLNGLYHISGNPISKHDLLTLVADVYGKEIEIIPDEAMVIDRSLNSERFRADAGFRPTSWEKLIKHMYGDYQCLKK